MSPVDLTHTERIRIRVLLALMIGAFVVIGFALWRIQVLQGKSYQRDLVRQSVRRVRLPGIRGRIFDRNGVCLADNRPSYCVGLFLEELRRPGKWSRTVDRVDRLMDEMAVVLDLPRTVGRDEIETHIRKRLPLPLLAWRDVDERTLARLGELEAGAPGVDLYIDTVRDYPLGGVACHVVGYVGRAEPPESEDEPYHFYLPEMEGRSGAERTFDGVLRGLAGGRVMRVDVSGFRHDDLAVRDPQRGQDLHLALDARAQKVLDEAMAEYRGAAVLVDPSNGDVLAMVSKPGYDPNLFSPAIPADMWKSLVEDEEKPLINRAIAGAYAPGSTFKPVVAMAALESGRAGAQTSFGCPGHFNLGRARFQCWSPHGHGAQNLRGAIQHSCNVYFYQLGLLCGHEPILHMAGALGLGRKTGVDLDFEMAGLLPGSAWKRMEVGDTWRDGDTCNLAIGQGFLLVTPLQMAMMTAALANGGHLYRPRIALGVGRPAVEGYRPIPPAVANELNWSRARWQVVREGMRAVVMSDRGTGKQAAVPDVEIAGKTGTAEYGRKGEGHKLAWMIAFAPYEAPRYALALMVEEGQTGGTTAAPLVKRILGGLFGAPGRAEGQG
jgi:penicillin-binding protein 2